jgi:uncharacterized protein (DUF433 family)
LLGTFDLHEPIEELRRPGNRAIERTRIPTSSVYALRTERDLPTAAIIELYPDLSAEAVDDAIRLESRLHGHAVSRFAA